MLNEGIAWLEGSELGKEVCEFDCEDSGVVVVVVAELEENMVWFQFEGSV